MDLYIHTGTTPLPCCFCQTPSDIIACFSVKKRMCKNCIKKCINEGYIHPITGQWYLHDNTLLIRTDIFNHTGTTPLPCYFCQIPSDIIACFSKKKRICENCIKKMYQRRLYKPYNRTMVFT